MTYKADPIAEKLDKLADATGMPRMQRQLARGSALRLRYFPLTLLAFAIAGLWVQIAVSEMFGFWILMMTWMVTLPLQQVGPLWKPKGDYDEREAAVLRHGHFVGLMWGFGVVLLGSLAMGLGKMGAQIRLWDIWTPTSGFDWLAVTFFLLNLELNIALLAASNATPEPLDDEEE